MSFLDDASFKIENITTDTEVEIVLEHDEEYIQPTVENNDVEILIVSDSPDEIIEINAEYNTDIRKGYSPYYSRETNTWWEYNDETQQYEDTHISPGGAVATEVKIINDVPDTFNLKFNEGMDIELTTPNILKDNYISHEDIDEIIREVYDT